MSEKGPRGQGIKEPSGRNGDGTGSLESSSVVLQAQDIWRVFLSGPERLEVLRGASLEVRRGECVAITGPSGTGKSTLLHILGGLDRPTRGRVLLDSLDIFGYPSAELPELRNQKVGFVFQFHHLLAEFTVLENVALPLLVAGRSANDAFDRARQVLGEIGFTERMSHRPAQLSGGEKSRTAVARALVNEPAVILADEPTGNLDAVTADALVDLLVHLNQARSMTTILVTHNDAVAGRAGRRFRLSDGVLHEEGTTKSQ